MDASSLEIIAAVAGGVGVIATQIRKGLRDRGDRNGMINSPYIAEHLVELRKAQSASGILERRKLTQAKEQPASPPQLPSGKDASG